MTKNSYDFLVIGAGIIGLSVARSLISRCPGARICIIEKEGDAAQHASGRNSGVLHAGFYYSADSLKARFAVQGNRRMKEFCKEHHLPINCCGKLIVACNDSEHPALDELYQRGNRNGASVRYVDEQEACEIDPNAAVYRRALWSPDTATIDPALVCRHLRDELGQAGVHLLFATAFAARSSEGIITSSGDCISTRVVINCAGLYADKIAHAYGCGARYTIIPFKGLYLKYSKNKSDIKTNIYPVPNLRNPFLGVHFTITVDGTIKIGPTAIPAFWRENYSGLANFNVGEFCSIMANEARLFISNAFGFRSLAFEEMRKYRKSVLIKLAARLVKKIDPHGFGEFTAPGIRAQLLDRETGNLVQDFVIEEQDGNVHVLNAVSPALTCAFPFADYLVDTYVRA